MNESKITIGVLTSSRADYSIYLPLLKAISKQKDMELNIIAFGTHLLPEYGYTLNHIEADGFNIAHKVDSMTLNDSPYTISHVIGETIIQFSKIWKDNKFDLLFALGDRYEMFAAVTSTVPFNIPVAHIHGGETTLGAIDNCFRHSITSMSYLHFVSTNKYKKRVSEIIGSEANIYNVGALSFENMKMLNLLSKNEFFEQFKIDLNIPSILITFHPETVDYNRNEKYVEELTAALSKLKNYQLIITMPNADTMGNLVRKKLQEFVIQNSNVIGIESFGTIGYLSCMKYCRLMLGNTSSGFVEAAFFPTIVINIGDRQKGRIITPNIINSAISESDILDAVAKAEHLSKINPIQIYGKGDSSKKIVDILRLNKDNLVKQ